MLRSHRFGRVGLLAALICAAGLLVASPALARRSPPPVASFTFSPSTPATGQTVTFQSTSTGSHLALEWDLDGSGSFSGGDTTTVIHSFATPGPHTVSLRVTDDQDRQSTTSQIVNVSAPDQPPAASFTYGPARPRAGETVTFSSSSYDPDGRITAQAWDLTGSGSFDGGTGTTATRVFPTPGTYLIRLRVWDNSGSVDTTTQSIVVSAGSLPSATRASGRGLSWLTPFPVVRLSGTVKHRSTRVDRLTVGAPAGALIELRCKGARCPKRKLLRVTRSSPGKSPVRFRQFERLFSPGLAIEVRVTKPGMVGKYTRFRIRSSRAPVRTDACLLPGRSAPVPCPAS